MNKLLKVEMYRVFNSKTLYISIAIGFLCCIWLLFEQLYDLEIYQEQILIYGTDKIGLYYPKSVYNQFIGLDYYHKQPQILYILFPILASLPFSTSYCFDKNNGYIKNIFSREDRKYYFLAKFISVFASGFVTVCSILLFSLIITMMFFPLLPPEIITAEFTPNSTDAMFFEIFQNRPMLYVLIYILIDGIYFGLIATIPLAISTFININFVIFISGTIVYYFFSYLMSAFKLYTYSPSIFLIPGQPFYGISFAPIIIQILLIILLVFLIFIKKEGKKDVF